MVLWKIWLLFAKRRIVETGSLYRYPQTAISVYAIGIIVLLCMLICKIDYHWGLFIYISLAVLGFCVLKFLTYSVAQALQDTAELMDLPEYIVKYRDITDENYDKIWKRMTSCIRCPYVEKLFAKKFAEAESNETVNSGIKNYNNQDQGQKDAWNVVSNQVIFGTFIEQAQIFSATNNSDKLDEPAAVSPVGYRDGIKNSHGTVAHYDAPQQCLNQRIISNELDFVKQDCYENICNNSYQENSKDIERPYEICHRYAFTPCWIVTESNNCIITIYLDAVFAAAKSYLFRTDTKSQVKSSVTKFVEYHGNKKTRKKKDNESNYDNNVFHIKSPSRSTKFLINISFLFWIGHLLVDICFFKACKPVKIINIQNFWFQEREFKESCFNAPISHRDSYDSDRYYDFIAGVLWAIVLAGIISTCCVWAINIG